MYKFDVDQDCGSTVRSTSSKNLKKRTNKVMQDKFRLTGADVTIIKIVF